MSNSYVTLMHPQPGILTSSEKWKTKSKSQKINAFGTAAKQNVSYIGK